MSYICSCCGHKSPSASSGSCYRLLELTSTFNRVQMVIYAGIAVINRHLLQVGHVQVVLTENMYILDSIQADISVNIVDTNLVLLQVVHARKVLIRSTNIYDGRITIFDS
jgi:hypothetical protein